MTFLQSLEKSDYKKKQKKKIENELPYFVTIVALLANSGLGPYYIFQKIRDINLLPTIRDECDKILKRIDLLGVDPLAAMEQAKDRPSSEALGDFLGGYVSSIQSGGNVLNYLKSKMHLLFERYAEKEKNSVSKVQALVEAYMTIQIVILAVYIMMTSMGPAMGADTSSGFKADYFIVILSPIIAMAFMFGAKGMATSKTSEIEIKKVLKIGIPCIAAAIVIILSGIVSSINASGYIVAGALIALSIWPAMTFKKTLKLSIDAEAATPKILRDITEARKAGIGPEKCVIHACKRTDYKSFNPIANALATKLEWGIPMVTIFESLQKEIKNYQVLINFRILIEVITSGGGSPQTLDSLADTSEKFHNVDKNKRDMLKPYVMIGFMLIAITSFTTLIVIDSFGNIGQTTAIDKEKIAQIEKDKNATLELLSISIVLQAWLSGLFLGKITSGSFSGGFSYGIILVIISLIGVFLVQFSLVDFNAMLAAKK